jgi:hypothetical protein
MPRTAYSVASTYLPCLSTLRGGAPTYVPTATPAPGMLG